MIKYSPNSVHTVGVLAVTLGLDVCSAGNLDVYVDQLSCAGAVLRACCLAPVQARRSVAPLSSEKHNGFSTLFLSAQIVLLVASGRSLVGPEGPPGLSGGGPRALLGPSSWNHGACARIPPSGFHFKDSSSRLPPEGFLLQDSSSRTPPQGSPLKDCSSRIPPSGFLLKDCP